MDRIVRIIAGAALILAATLKGRDIADGFPPPFFDSRVVSALIVSLELGAGLLLVLASRSRVLHHVAAAGFLTFSAYAGIRWLQGFESCGCFGRLVVSPKLTLLFDLTVALELLILMPPRPSHRPLGILRFCGIGSAILACTVSLSTLSVGGGTAGIRAVSANEMLLTPTSWTGIPFPLLNRVRGVSAGDLTVGSWHVVLMSSECGECLRRVSSWRRAALDGKTRYVLIDITGRGLPQEESTATYRLGALDASVKYYVRTPTELLLVDSVVKEIK